MFCKAGDSKREWDALFATINGEGILILFEDEAMEIKKGNFDLSLWAQDDIVKSPVATKLGTHRITMHSPEGSIQFAFESEQQCDAMMHALRQHVGDHEYDDDSYLHFTANNVLQRFADSSMTELKAEVNLEKIEADNLVTVGERAFVIVDGNSKLVVFWAPNEGERSLWIQNMQNRINMLSQLDWALFETANMAKADEAVKRLIESLNFFADLKLKAIQDPTAIFTEFCDRHYGEHEMLRDYVHFMDHHSSPEAVREIAARLKVQCDGVGQCGGTLRHFRDRGGGGQEVEEKVNTNFYVDTMDSLHFYLFHLEEMGLRVPAEVVESALKEEHEEQDEQSLVDAVSKRMALEIAARRKLLSVDRLDGATNTKFNISTLQKKRDAVNGLWSLKAHCLFL